MTIALRKIKIEGFKSIQSAELALGDLNVVIGANGSGKSNLIGAFRLLNRILSKNLQVYVAGEPDRFLFHGRKVTPAIFMDFSFQNTDYGFKLKASKDSFIFEYERVDRKEVILTPQGPGGIFGPVEKSGHKESELGKNIGFLSNLGFVNFPVSEPNNFIIYHFHDTSDSSPAKSICDVENNRILQPDAVNLPAFLYWLKEKHPLSFQHIQEHIRLVAPFFDRFDLAPSRLNERKIKLEWKQKGSDAYFDAYSLSDGTLRFICLATLLLQPSPPALILLDEPELGLHPFALCILAEMLEAVSNKAQVLLATQSVTLLNHFAPKDVIVAENDGLKTTFQRLDEEKLKHWLDEFSIGELWEKNVLGGRP